MDKMTFYLKKLKWEVVISQCQVNMDQTKMEKGQKWDSKTSIKFLTTQEKELYSLKQMIINQR